MTTNKNHFFISYAGNKRNEFNKAYEIIKDRLDDIEYIIEPYCGTSAFSYFLSLKHPKKFKYILNDNCKHLIECYKIFKDDEKRNDFIKLLDKWNLDLTKEEYKNIVNKDDTPNWFFKHKFCAMRPGLYPLNKKFKISGLEKVPIIDFLKNENIEFLNIDGIDVIKKYIDNSNAFIFLDPPYMMSCNSLYDSAQGDIYEYLNSINLKNYQSFIMLMLENNWICKLMFKNYDIIEYSKEYQITKKKTNHFILINRVA
jgi:site-specific DNA-adenine methylase